jgi:hypothetical protein
LPVGNYTATALNAVGAETKTPFIGNFLFSLVVNHSDTIFQSLTANLVNVRTAGITTRQSLSLNPPPLSLIRKPIPKPHLSAPLKLQRLTPCR